MRNSATFFYAGSDQPFIENARNAEGVASYNRIINPFGDWMLSKADALPKFDIAVLISSAKMEWYGGLAYVGTACHKSRAVGLWGDDGKYGDIYVGVHEIGHILGAKHDSALDWCSDRGYIMANPNLKGQFFSSCSDRQISQYARSSQGACLRNIDHEGPLPIDPSFTDALPPSMDEQCKIRAKNPNAYVKEENTAACTDTWCDVGSYSFKFKPMEHTSCLGGGRCFRYGCRGPASLLRNVGTGQCVGSNRFDFRDRPKMIRCPEYPTPLDQFAPWNDTRWNSFALPWSTTDATDYGNKCLVNDNYADDSTVSYDKCDSIGNGNGRHGWETIDVGNGEFLLMHRVNKNCVKPLGNELRGYKSCDKNDASFRWKFIDQK